MIEDTVKQQKLRDTLIIWIFIISISGYLTIKLFNIFRRARADGLFVTCQVYIKEIGEAIEEYKTKNGRYPASLSQLTPKYIKKIRNCPTNEKKNYKFIISKDQKRFTIFCEGDYHEKTAGIGINYPQYSSIHGLIPGEESLVSIFNREKKREGFPQCQQNLRITAAALEKFKQEHKGKYPEDLASLVPKYTIKIPKCPSVEKDTYSNGYIVNTERDVFTLYCNGLNHYFSGVDDNYPRFYSGGGLVSQKKNEPKQSPTVTPSPIPKTHPNN